MVPGPLRARTPAGRTVWGWGLTARLEAVTMFDIYDCHAEHVLLRVAATFTNTLSLPLALGSPPYLRYHQGHQRISETGAVHVALRPVRLQRTNALAGSSTLDDDASGSGRRGEDT